MAQSCPFLLSIALGYTGGAAYPGSSLLVVTDDMREQKAIHLATKFSRAPCGVGLRLVSSQRRAHIFALFYFVSSWPIRFNSYHSLERTLLINQFHTNSCFRFCFQETWIKAKYYMILSSHTSLTSFPTTFPLTYLIPVVLASLLFLDMLSWCHFLGLLYLSFSTPETLFSQ